MTAIGRLSGGRISIYLIRYIDAIFTMYIENCNPDK